VRIWLVRLLLVVTNQLLGNSKLYLLKWLRLSICGSVPTTSLRILRCCYQVLCAESFCILFEAINTHIIAEKDAKIL
jgi:hypothetical protein